MLDYPLLEKRVDLLGSIYLILSVKDALVIQVLLFLLHSLHWSSTSFVVRRHILDPLLYLFDLAEGTLFYLSFESLVLGFDTAQLLLLLLDFSLKLGPGLEALLEAILDMLVPVDAVHFDESFSLLVLLSLIHI